jgi:hypothetical protein
MSLANVAAAGDHEVQDLLSPRSLQQPGHVGGTSARDCPETLRTAEISTADQTLFEVHPPRSEGTPHKTRPTGRLVRPRGRTIG